jgi:hypothetical protein
MYYDSITTVLLIFLLFHRKIFVSKLNILLYEICEVKEVFYLKDTVKTVISLSSKKISPSHPRSGWQFRGNFFSQDQAHCVQQMQCWVFSMGTFMTEFYLISFLCILDMVGPG